MENRLDISVRDLLFIIRKNIVILLLIISISSFSAYFISKNVITPVYECEANIMLLQKDSTASGMQKVINAFAYLMKKQSLLEKVAIDCGAAAGPGYLAENIVIDQVGTTEFFTMKVRNANPDNVDAIINSVLRLAPPEISQTLEVEFEIVVLSKVTRRIAPNVTGNTLMGFFIGLAASFIYIVAFELFKNRIVSEDDIKRILGFRTIGVIPKMKLPGATKSVVIAHGSNPGREMLPLIESYNALRTNLTFLSEKTTKKIMISSSVREEGRTSIAINLAASLARLGKKALLIDTDLRNPAVARYLGITGNDVTGLSDLLLEEMPAEKAIRYIPTLGFSVIVSGRNIANQNETLQSAKMRALLKKLEMEYDYLIFDSPPISLYSDALAMIDDMDGVILIVRQNFTDHETALFVKRSLENVNANVIGCVISMFDAKHTNKVYTFKPTGV